MPLNNFGGVTNPASFPLMPYMVTASTSQYKQCNERFQKLRMRFVSATTSYYAYSGDAAI